MDKTDKTLSDAQLIERTIDFAGDLQKQVYDLQIALSESQKHLADANRGAQRQSGVNQLLVKELVQVKNALSEKEKECERLREALRMACSDLQKQGYLVRSEDFIEEAKHSPYGRRNT